MTVRCFFCVELPEELKEGIALWMNTYRKQEPELKWVKKEALHITLRFCGELEVKLVKSICKGLHNELSSFCVSPLRLELSGTGVFPDPCKARVLWAGIEEGAIYLERLHTLIEKVLSDQGIEPEKRSFHPHVTLARAKKDSKADRSFVKDFLEHPFSPCTWLADRITFMESELFPSGPEYKPIDHFRICPRKN